MLKRVWRRLVRFLRRLWRTSPQPSPMRRGSQNFLTTSSAQNSNLPAQISPQPDSVMPADNDEAKTWCDRGNEQYDAGDFREAVASYDQAVKIQPDDHDAWNKRGNALGSLGRFEEAIASYDKSLEIKPDYHKAWYNRGNALLDLGRYEEAIASFDKAVKFKPDFHEAWNNRGNTLGNLARYEEAIASYDQAVKFKPDFHEAWNNRGNTLGNLARYEEAIASYDQALKIKPDDYKAWYMRGFVLGNLRQYEQAITSYDKALQIQPDFYNAWYNQGMVFDELGQYEQALASFDKALQIKPNFHQAWFLRGIALDKLGQYEEEIASFDKALQIKPDKYKAWNKRGVAAGKSRNHNPQAAIILQMQFPASPVVQLNPTLTRRGYEGQLLSLQEGLKHCPQPESQGLLYQAIGETHYQEGQGKPDYRQYCHKAIKSYDQALTTLTQDAFPELHLSVLQKYIKPLFDLGKIAEAAELQRRGTDLLRRLFADKNRTDKTKKELALQFISFNQLTVDLAVQSGEVIKALEVAESGKNACLTWLLYAWNDEIPEPNWQEIKQLLNPSTAIIYWHISPATITTFILKYDSPIPLLVTSTNQEEFPSQLKHLQKFEGWVKDWNEQYLNYRSKAKKQLERSNHSWRLEMEERLEILKNILNISAIEQELKYISNLILIPHRDLHRFPIHALFDQELDLTITYLPSAEIGINLQQRQPNLSNRLLSIEHPESKDFAALDFAQIESEAISQMFDNPKRIQSKKATKNQVGAELLDEYNIFHFAGHGTYNFTDPKKSELVLANEDKLTLEEICQKNLVSYNLVTLSACETALTGNQTITTEYVGLVSGFLSRGVANVVSTLWTVESAASALVMIEFYRRRQSSKSEAVALKEATQWLKELTVQQLKEWYEAFLIKLPADELRISAFIETELYRFGRMELDKKPYDHPYYWAAFIVTGNPS